MGLNQTHYAKWKEKKETQNGHSQAQEALEEKQTQEKITDISPSKWGTPLKIKSFE
jgi:hypothetical protein